VGQYLGIGIVTECAASKRELESGGISKEELIAKMETEFYFEPSIYDFSETENSILFTLKPEVFEKQLLPFLRDFYPFIYMDSKGYVETLNEIEKINSSEWLQLAGDKSCAEFQLDEYGEKYYLYFDKPFRPSVVISSSSILLSFEGKILMECYGKQFNFFKYCIQQTFTEYSLAKAIRVYITG
jgi:hypothetical protein